MFESLCQITHEKLVNGKCPWCGHVIVDGRDVQSTVRVTITDMKERIPDPQEAAEVVKKMIPLLHALLRKGNATMRMMAATCLGEIGPDAKEALPMLSLLLQDTNRLVREAAKEAIRKITEGESTELPPSVDQTGG